ncbi:hypothetical protein ACWEQH_35575 [Streptomyces sp. NPDC004166]
MSADPVPAPAELAGKLITPDDSRYGLLRSTYTTVGRPAVVVLPQSAATSPRHCGWPAGVASRSRCAAVGTG